MVSVKKIFPDGVEIIEEYQKVLILDSEGDTFATISEGSITIENCYTGGYYTPAGKVLTVAALL